jgi:methylenetetrahydrofolate dehydrogenase (NADP+)/methenyltetrahydrofolate cyclohydrolase
MTKILDGRALARTLRDEVAEEVRDLIGKGLRPPGLSVILVGENSASQVYVRSKERAAAEAGFTGGTVRLPADATTDDVSAEIDRLNADDSIDGFLIQLPLPKGLPERELLDRVDPGKDVDGFHPLNVGRLWLGRPAFAPATPAGILELLHRQQLDLVGRHAVIVGRSAIVGKPMAALLLREHCTVTICHSRTRDLQGICRQADLLVAAVGRPGMIGPDHVKEGAVVIDVGINRLTERRDVERFFPGDDQRMATFERRGSTLVGDVDFHAVASRCRAITPVPGGVGPLTVASLLVNGLTAAKRHLGLDEEQGD